MFSFAPQNKMMKKIIAPALAFLIITLFVIPKVAVAGECIGLNDERDPYGKWVKITYGGLIVGNKYRIEVSGNFFSVTATGTNNIGYASLYIDKDKGEINDRYNYFAERFFKPGSTPTKIITDAFISSEVCSYKYIFREFANSQCTKIEIPNGAGQTFHLGNDISVEGTITNLPKTTLLLRLIKPNGDESSRQCPETNISGSFSTSLKINEGQAGLWNIHTYRGTPGLRCDTAGGTTELCPVLQVGVEVATPEKPTTGGKAGTPADACGAIKDTKSNEYNKCTGCITGKPVKDPNYPGSWSALGCIPTGPEKFIQWLLNSAINIVGGLAFLMILFGSFKVATSSGNPEALTEGKDIIFAALAGLLFIVFSVILLKIIGADILQIPGFQ